MVVTGVCSACHCRPAKHIFTAAVRPDGPIEDAAVCEDCYPILVVALEREALENARTVTARFARTDRC